MPESRLGLTGAVAIALGGTIAGGIFAILSIVGAGLLYFGRETLVEKAVAVERPR
jgi:hypothetical protein